MSQPSQLLQEFASSLPRATGRDIGTGEAFGAGALSSLSLGYYEPENLQEAQVQHPLATMGGQIVGGLPAAATAAMGGGAAGIGLGVGRVLGTIGAGGLLGLSRKAESAEERLKNAAEEALLFGVFEGASPVVKAVAPKLKGVGKEVAKTATIGTGALGVELGAGEELEDALVSAGVMAGLHGVTAGIRGLVPKRVPMEGDVKSDIAPKVEPIEVKPTEKVETKTIEKVVDKPIGLKDIAKNVKIEGQKIKEAKIAEEVRAEVEQLGLQEGAIGEAQGELRLRDVAENRMEAIPRDVTEGRIEVPQELAPLDIKAQMAKEQLSSTGLAPEKSARVRVEDVFTTKKPTEGVFVGSNFAPEIDRFIAKTAKTIGQSRVYNTISTEIKKQLAAAKINTINFGRKLAEYISGKWKGLTTAARNALQKAHEYLLGSETYKGMQEDAKKLYGGAPIPDGALKGLAKDVTKAIKPKNIVSENIEESSRRMPPEEKKVAKVISDKAEELSKESADNWAKKVTSKTVSTGKGVVEAWNDKTRKSFRRISKLGIKESKELVERSQVATRLSSELRGKPGQMVSEVASKNPHGIWAMFTKEGRAARKWIFDGGFKKYIESGAKGEAGPVDKAWLGELTNTFNTVMEGFNKVAKELIPDYKPRTNYFSHMYRREALTAMRFQSGPLWNAMLEKAKLKGINRDTFTKYSEKLTENKFGFLEAERKVDLGDFVTINGKQVPITITDPFVVMERYIRGASARLGFIKGFGKGEKAIENINRMIKAIQTEVQAKGGNSYAEGDFLKSFIEQYQGVPIEKSAPGVVQKTLTIAGHLIRPEQLGLGAITNFFLGPIPAIVRFELKNSLKALNQILFKGNPLEEKFLEWGSAAKEHVSLDASLSDLMAEGKLGRYSKARLKYQGFNYVNRFINYISDYAALEYFGDAVKKGNRRVTKTLIDDFYFTEAEVEAMFKRGSLVESEQANIARRASALTNLFGESPLDSQPWLQGDFAKQIMAYTRPAMMLSETLAYAVSEAQAGNVKPIVSHLFGGLVGAELTVAFKNVLKKRERQEDNFMERLYVDLLHSSLAGFPSEVAQRAYYAKKFSQDPLSTLPGPTIGVLSEVLASLMNNKPLIKTYRRNSPLIDSILTQMGVER